MYYDVIFYRDDRGRCPVSEFLDELEEQAKTNKLARQLFKKVVFYIEVLEKNGTRAGMPYTRHIGDGIWELRPKDQRIFFFSWHSNQIVLLHPFRKDTGKTPRREIEKAKSEMNDWLDNGDHRITGK